VNLCSREQAMNTIGNLSEKSLDEVREDHGQILDNHSILAGHCIENDMNYLQICYPSIIDTSIIYNCQWNEIREIKFTKTPCDLLRVSFHSPFDSNSSQIFLVD